MIRVVLPYHLRMLANIAGEVTLDIADATQGVHTLRTVLVAIETKYPMLRGTIRDQKSQERRPMVRFFVCEEDWSHESHDTTLPRAIALGEEPLLIVGAIAGG